MAVQHSGEIYLSKDCNTMVIYDEPDKMLTVTDAAEIIHVHPNTLRRWHDQGRIEACRIGTRGDRRFWQSAIARFITEFNPYKQNECNV
jgi:excisionase family DNA binding protein